MRATSPSAPSVRARSSLTCRSTRVSLGRLSRRARRSTSSTAARAQKSTDARALAPARGFGDRVAVVVDRAKASASAAATSMSPGGLALALALVAAAAAAAARFRGENRRASAKRTVILGGGFAGSQIARDLRGKRRVTVVETKSYFEFVPGTPSAAAGAAPLRAATRFNLRANLRARRLLVPLTKVLGRGVAVERVRAGEAVRVTSEKTVRVGEGRTLEYDELVVAVGSEYPSGLKASCDPNEEDAEIGARAREMARVRETMDEGKSIVVVGGGVVGVELACELAERQKKRGGGTVNLLHSGPRLLDTLPEFVSEYASKALVSRGVRVYVGQTYDREGDSFIGAMNKNVIEGDRVAWCVGAKPNTDFLRVKGSRFVDSQDYEDGEGSVDEDDDALHVPLDIIGRVRVDDGTRQVIGLDDVYAVGDCACKLPDQMLASYAHWEAEYVAKRLLCEGDENKLRRLGPYRLPPRLMAISLGPFDGVVLWGDRVVLRGWFAACLKALVQFWFIRFLPAPYAVAKRLPSLRTKPPTSLILRRPLAN